MPGKAVLKSRIKQTPGALNITQKIGLYQNRRNMRSPQNREIGLLRMPGVQRVDAADLLEHQAGKLQTGIQAARLQKVENNVVQIIARPPQGHAADKIGGVFLLGGHARGIAGSPLKGKAIDGTA